MGLNFESLLNKNVNCKHIITAEKYCNLIIFYEIWDL